MSDNYLQLRKISFSGVTTDAVLEFKSGVNVICGASDTGKSFLAESIDFMLGASELREIPERVSFSNVALELAISNGEKWQLQRSLSGGNFKLIDLIAPDNQAPETLKKAHAHDRIDNLSGFLLNKIGLLGKRILKSSHKGTTQSLSFRNLARLVIVQEDEIQQIGSPFWGGQFTLKTGELATAKLLLTGVDDSTVITPNATEPDNTKQLELLDDLLADLQTQIQDLNEIEVVTEQLAKLESAIAQEHKDLNLSQSKLDTQLEKKRDIYRRRQELCIRRDEVTELLARFELLSRHYKVDIDRLTAIQESGQMFAHLSEINCPLCGSSPTAKHTQHECDGNVDAIVQSASAELLKVNKLQKELLITRAELNNEQGPLKEAIKDLTTEYENLSVEIQQGAISEINNKRAAYSALIDGRSKALRSLDVYEQFDKLQARKRGILEEETDAEANQGIAIGIPDFTSHKLSLKVASVLKAWNFPGACLVHFDKKMSDFVIDGKARGSRGKGLRAITHSAVTIALLEYCQENGLPHPGFVVLDSPLLAYYKPEGEEDTALQGSDLKERFYEYLLEHHATDSQIIIIENQHPPVLMESRLALTVFTGNPNKQRFGLL